MVQISASLVKELRDLTGAGMMDCKKALTETNGDIEKAVLWLREQGLSKAAKRSGRVAAEGLTKVISKDNKAVILEVNSETDFVARNDQFLDLIDQVAAEILVNGNVKTLEEALALTVKDQTLEELIVNASATIGEKITLRRFEIVTKEPNEVFGTYVHMGGKISTVAVLSHATEEIAKDIAMQVASMSPQFISREYMDEDFINQERSVQTEIARNDEALAGKPEKVLEGIIEGRLSKTLEEVSLMDQVFFKDQKITVQKYLDEAKATVTYFVRYGIGEGLDKGESCSC